MHLAAVLVHWQLQNVSLDTLVELLALQAFSWPALKPMRSLLGHTMAVQCLATSLNDKCAPARCTPELHSQLSSIRTAAWPELHCSLTRSARHKQQLSVKQPDVLCSLQAAGFWGRGRHPGGVGPG